MLHCLWDAEVSELVSSFLTAHQHILGYLVPCNGENVINFYLFLFMGR